MSSFNEPWSREEIQCDTVIRDSTGFAFCQCWHFLNDQHEANVNLISAAPDLLAACEKLVDYRRRAGPLGFQLEKADDFIHMMKVAITKATTTPSPHATNIEGE